MYIYAHTFFFPHRSFISHSFICLKINIFLLYEWANINLNKKKHEVCFFIAFSSLNEEEEKMNVVNCVVIV